MSDQVEGLVLDDVGGLPGGQVAGPVERAEPVRRGDPLHGQRAGRLQCPGGGAGGRPAAGCARPHGRGGHDRRGGPYGRARRASGAADGRRRAVLADQPVQPDHRRHVRCDRCREADRGRSGLPGAAAGEGDAPQPGAERRLRRGGRAREPDEQAVGRHAADREPVGAQLPLHRGHGRLARAEPAGELAPGQVLVVRGRPRARRRLDEGGHRRGVPELERYGAGHRGRARKGPGDAGAGRQLGRGTDRNQVRRRRGRLRRGERGGGHRHRQRAGQRQRCRQQAPWAGPPRPRQRPDEEFPMRRVLHASPGWQTRTTTFSD